MIPFDLPTLCAVVRKVSRRAGRWFTIRRAWRLLARLGRRKYARAREGRLERRWTRLQEQTDTMIRWRVSKWKQHTCDTVLRDVFDWLVFRYGEKVHVTTDGDQTGGDYIFQGLHLPTSFYVGLRSTHGRIRLWMLGVPVRSHLSYVIDAGEILTDLPDGPDGSSVRVKLDLDNDQDEFPIMVFKRLTYDGDKYLMGDRFHVKHQGYIKVALRSVLHLEQLDDSDDEPLTPYRPA
jgi:hypothetical protein